ncbi:MAG: hypothetical protein IJ408_03385 [Clostridia bacterium]|nr:hypothetical protein [Clostridia bacterium]MBQ8793289.1 hypothetical protein [Clostridia bacterium]
MKLCKKDCNIKIKLEPSGTQFLGIYFDFGKMKFSFGPSSCMSGQFGELVSALYSLYSENYDGHNEWYDREAITYNDHTIHTIKANVSWDNEGTIMDFTMTRKITEEVISIDIKTTDGEEYSIAVDGKSFCYAVAKACTDVLKEYGIYGYRCSTEYDTFKLHQLLFIKAYALDCMQVRELVYQDDCQKTDFNKEIELLIFDM